MTILTVKITASSTSIMFKCANLVNSNPWKHIIWINLVSFGPNEHIMANATKTRFRVELVPYRHQTLGSPSVNNNRDDNATPGQTTYISRYGQHFHQMLSSTNYSHLEWPYEYNEHWHTFFSNKHIGIIGWRKQVDDMSPLEHRCSTIENKCLLYFNRHTWKSSAQQLSQVVLNRKLLGYKIYSCMLRL